MERRITVLATDALRVELLRCTLDRARTPETYTLERQVLFPLAGTFRWHVGRTTELVDPNTVIFVETNEASCDSHPTSSDVTCLIATVSQGTARRLWPSSVPFRARTARASQMLQLGYARFAGMIGGAAVEPAVWEARALALLARATREAAGQPERAPCAAHELARRAKERLTDRGPLRRLASLADDLDVSPAYLTDAFRRAEGVPLVQYQLQLRVMRALHELPHTDDLAALALELGFSSHSHFSTAFRAATGVTPSRYRGAARDRKKLKARVPAIV